MMHAGPGQAQPVNLPVNLPAAAAAGPPASASTEAVVDPTAPALARVTLVGKLLPADSIERLQQFLDVRLPGSWDAPTQARVQRDLEVLGYQASIEVRPIGGAGATTNELLITLHPLRVVRRIFVSGNWPIFAWEVQSYMTWKTGYRLPERGALVAEIRNQEQELVRFLQRSGYYDAKARIFLDWEPETPEQVDVRVQIDLNIGFFRLKYNIGEVRGEGFKLLSPTQLTDFFDHCCLWLGRTSTERINDDFKRLSEFYQSKGYVGIRLTKREIHPDHVHKRVDLDLAVEERKRVVLHFIGRKKIAEKELMKTDVVTIFRDNYASPNELDESARNIFRYYQSQGFFEARVGWRWRNRSGDPVEVDFVIHEGPQLKVRDIEFLPALGSPPLTIATAKLNEQVKIRRYPRLGLIGLGEGGFASAILLDQDVKRLEEYLRQQGYPTARVYVEMARSRAALDSAALLGLETTTDATSDDADLYLRFRIAPGKRREFASVEVSFVGPHSLTEAQVLKVLGLLAGKPFTLEAIEEDKRRLAELFRSVGHPYADLDPSSSTWNSDQTAYSLRWVISENELVTFGPIIIRGNFVTRESVVRKDLPFKTGDPYDGNKILEAQQNLIGRYIYTHVRVTPNPGETDEYRLEAHQKGWSLRRNPVPVLVEVVERYDNSGQIDVGVGVSTDNPIYSTASYTWKNLSGLGIDLEARGELGVRVQSLLLRVSQPRLGSPFLRADLSGFWRSENTYSVGLVQTYGANAELTRSFAPTDEQGRRLPPRLRLFTRLEFNFSQILVPLYRTEGTTDVPVDGDRTQALKLSFGLVWDRRVGFDAPARVARNLPVLPNPLMPVSGFMLSALVTGSLCCSFAPFNGQGSFVAFATQAILLRPFGPEMARDDGWPYEGMRRFNLKLNLRVHYGIPLFSPALPVVERYFAGGDSSTRGYDTDALKAEEVRTPVGSLAGDLAYRVVPVGGSARILSQIEWEFAITPKLLGWPWYGAMFVDTGAVFDGWDKLRWNDVRFSVGVSLLRLLTPFGALSLDYAYPLTLPGQDPLLQSDRWKFQSWYEHFPGRIHFTWGMAINR